MKSKIKISHILIILLGVMIFSCKKYEKFPPEPKIEYLGFEKIFNATDSIYDRGVLMLSYTDGDGDLGLEKNDTFPPYNYGSKYYYNMIIKYFEIQEGKITEVYITYYNPSTQEFDTITQNARMPTFISDADKSISGEIYDTLFMYNYNSDYDSILFEAYIIDRALNESNVVRTDTIIRK